MTNAIVDDPLTPNQAEEEQTPTESQGETSPEDKKGTEPPQGSKSWEHALQQSREREKKERAEREAIQQELEDTKSRLEEYELQGLTDTEKYRIEAEKSKAEAQDLRRQLEIEEVKRLYRKFLTDRESSNPKTVAFLRRQMDKNIYPIQGENPEEFDANFTEFATEYEGIPQETTKPATDNPAFTPPSEVDMNTLSPEELRKILPIAAKD